MFVPLPFSENSAIMIHKPNLHGIGYGTEMLMQMLSIKYDH